MAQEIIRKCDFEEKGSKCGEIVNIPPTTFSVGRKEYEADFCEKHAAKFEAALEPFTKNAVPANRRPVNVLRPPSARTYNSQQIREWLAAQGRTVNPKGRIPNILVDEYMAAHGK